MTMFVLQKYTVNMLKKSKGFEVVGIANNLEEHSLNWMSLNRFVVAGYFLSRR
ncbi:MAG: hypothetical protein CM1200mP28_13320 [Deltaproteobacteria bacterium]|nr:MAG: hypothetical protein CM1200mP28_13320 [Deltaproteobacteria bacterium]